MKFQALSQVTLALGLARQGSAQTATDPSCDFKYLTQQLDHFGESNQTFQQRYSIFPEFFKPGGPILFFQGEESLLDCANTTIFYEWAKETNGVAVSLEHRYFGESLPFGNASWTTANMKYLTLDNVMDDAVTFIDFIKANVTGDPHSNTLIGSGSYGGFLATAFRQNHPDTFTASLASAGPVQGFGNSSDPSTYNWWNYVNHSYLDKSKEASENIKSGFDAIVKKLQSGNFTGVQQDLELCYTPTEANQTLVTYHLSTTFMTAVEFNYAVAEPGRGPVAEPLDQVIKIALETENHADILKQVAWLMYYGGEGKAPCLDIADSRLLAPAIQTQPFGYITCTYLPLNSDVPSGIIFPAIGGSDQKQASCRALYGNTTVVMTQEQIWSRYKLSPEHIRNSTQIVFSEAQYDPTTAVGPDHLPLTNNPCASRLIYTTDMAHREDLFAPDPDDKQTVIDLRKSELEIFKEWFEYCS